MDKPREAPTTDKIEAAWRVYDEWQLHYYQLLYFQRPQLTSPGKPGYPFTVMLAPNAMLCLKVVAEQAPEYSFTIHNYLPKDWTQEQYDAEIVRRCKLIKSAIAEQKQKFDVRACCGLAQRRNCICYFSCICEIHGTKCVGSHD